MATRIKLKGDTHSAWTSSSLVLLEREIGLVTDLYEYVVGDGVSLYSELENFPMRGSGESKLDSDKIVTKTLTKTWEDLFAEIEAYGSNDFNGYTVTVIVEDGVNQIGNFVYSSPFWKNGTLKFVAENGISGNSGVDQNSTISSNGTGGWSFNGTIDVMFDSLKIEVSASGNPTPFQNKSGNVQTNKCWFDASTATNSVTMFMSGNGKVTSVNDTFSGSSTVDTAISQFGAGLNQICGGSVGVFNANLSGDQFTNISKGNGFNNKINSDGVFVNN